MSKKVNLAIIGLDPDIYTLTTAFTTQARKEKWEMKSISEITIKAFAAPNYGAALAIISSHCRVSELEEYDSHD